MTADPANNKPLVKCIIDSHMHIQSGACAPLPLLYNQLASKIKFNPKGTPGLRSRAWIDGISMVVLGNGGRLQTLDCIKIGDRAVKDNFQTYLNLKNSRDFCRPEATEAPFAAADATDVHTVYIKDKSKSIELLSGKSYHIIIQEADDFVFCPMMVMPMDMEYAHIAGYDGRTIYHEENGEVFYYHRNSGICAEELGEKVDLSHEIEKKKKALKLKKWYKQYEEHLKSATIHPFQLIPLYHYEPRRWRLPDSAKTDEASFSSGNWDYPFKYIATEINSGVFAGFKMYTPLGYRPLDDKLPQMSKYYEKCEKEKIPIVNHCSAGGMLTHEQSFYKEYIEKGYKYFPEQKKDNPAFSSDASFVNLSPVADNRASISATSPPLTTPEEVKQTADEWFTENYVHPKAWRKVLDKFPNLYLCLAHFGGDDWEYGPQKSDWIQELISMLTEKGPNNTPRYPNLFTDISCFSIDDNMPNFISTMRGKPELWDKVLFGTDWYMTLIVSESGQQRYDEFCCKMKEELDKIDDTIWIRVTFLNPVRFYGLEKMIKLNNMKDALKTTGANSDKLETNMIKFVREIKKLETIKKSL
jgi:predicted TIM-barrel fold metal-dependent hydrolase